MVTVRYFSRVDACHWLKPATMIEVYVLEISIPYLLFQFWVFNPLLLKSDL